MNKYSQSRKINEERLRLNITRRLFSNILKYVTPWQGHFNSFVCEFVLSLIHNSKLVT